MKKIISAIVVAATISGSSFAASTLNWANAASAGGSSGATPGQDILDQSGNFLPMASTFIVRLYQSVNNIIEWNTATKTGGGDETLIAEVAFNTMSWDDGAFAKPLQVGTYSGLSGIVNGSFIYSVILNAASAGAATASAILDGAGIPGGTATTAVIAGNGVGNYDTTGQSTVAPYNWILAVPEPSTYAFMGIGAVLLAVRRLRRS